MLKKTSFTPECEFSAPSPVRSSVGSRYVRRAKAALFGRAACALLAGAGVLAATGYAGSTYSLIAIACKDARADRTVGLTTMNQGQLGKFKMIYASHLNNLGADFPLKRVQDTRNPTLTKVIPYQGGYTTNYAGDADRAQDVQYLAGIAMTRIGTLGDLGGLSGIEAGETSIKINVDAAKRTYLPLVAATNPSEVVFSSEDTAPGGSKPLQLKQYDSWIRVGDEVMKVTSVTPASGNLSATLTVGRGYKSTLADHHDVNTVVLGPVYLGNNTNISPFFDNSYPTNPFNNFMRYAMDPGQTKAKTFRVSIMADFENNNGYDGGWWDTFNQVFSNLCDAAGNHIRPVDIWDFTKATPGPYTDESAFLTKLKNYVQNVRADPLLDADTVIYANVGFGGYDAPDSVGSEILANILGTPGVTNRLDGAAFEDSFLDRDNSYAPYNETEWEERMAKMIEAANSQRYFICMMGPAGTAAAVINNEMTGYQPRMRFSFASFLMAVKNGADPSVSTLSFGMPLLVNLDQVSMRMLSLRPVVMAAVGTPQQGNALTATRMAANPLGYSRFFTTGFAAVNTAASGGAVITVTVPAYRPSTNKWYDADSPASARVYYIPGQTINLNPGDGLVLVGVQE